MKNQNKILYTKKKNRKNHSIIMKSAFSRYTATVDMFPELMDFRNPYFTTQLITYIGNKRSLLPFVNQAISDIKQKLNKDKLCIFEGFSGSGSVSRLLKYYASQLFVNDMEDYCEILSKCYLANKSEIDLPFISETIQWLKEEFELWLI
ncbi:MAG: DNA adenine methylase [Elusimicrobia bacterium]|nr:DNA adenine methylase [Elusimicrobiota bacterium]